MMENPHFLYETLDALNSAGMLSPMPDIIERNLQVFNSESIKYRLFKTL